MHTPKRSAQDRRKADRRRKKGSAPSGRERRVAPVRQGERRKQGQDNDIAKGAMETEGSGGNDQVSMTGQLSHRGDDQRLNRGQDAGLSESGQSPEHSGQRGGPPPTTGRR